MASPQKLLLVIAGATGQQGSSVIHHLHSQNQWRIRGLCRHTDSSAAKKLIELGVELISCDLSNKDQVMHACKDAYGIFGMTQFWQPDIMHHPETELEQGKALVEAAIANHVKHFIWSSLVDAKALTNNELNVWHFTMKNKVEQYAVEHATDKMKLTFVYPASFYQNILDQHFVVHHPTRGLQVTLQTATDPDVKLPWFDVNETGRVVAKIFDHPELFPTKKRILMAGDEFSYKEVAQLMQHVFNTQVVYEQLNEKESDREYGFEITEMALFFNRLKGYYADNQHDAVEECKRLFNLTTFDKWLEKNKNMFKFD